MRINQFSDVNIASVIALLPDKRSAIESMQIPPHEIEKYLLIAKKLGVEETRVLGEQDIISLIKVGIERTLRHSRISVQDISYVICITQTNKFLIPGMSSLIQNEYRFSDETRFFDLSQGCAGFVDGIQLAAQLCARPKDRILLITAEVMSHTLDPQDYGNRLLFGDACSVTLIEFQDQAPHIFGFMKYDGTGYRGAFLKSNNFNDGENFFSLNGPAAFSLALKAFDDAKSFINQVGFNFEDLDAIIPHQANTFILEKIAIRHLIMDSIVNEMKYTGNTSSNSIPVGMTAHIERTGKRFGRNTLCVGFGNGFSWGAILVDFSNTYFETA
jgi:3-oxoacyl-[acyl-carrier-protein] synthase-3